MFNMMWVESLFGLILEFFEDLPSVEFGDGQMKRLRLCEVEIETDYYEDEELVTNMNAVLTSLIDRVCFVYMDADHITKEQFEQLPVVLCQPAPEGAARTRFSISFQVHKGSKVRT